MANGHGGNVQDLAAAAGRGVEDLLDFSANINPLGPPPGLRAVISRGIEQLVHYPDPQARGLVAAISKRYGAPAGQVIVGNGSTEILYALTRAIAASPMRPRVVVPVPAYIDYAAAARLAGLEVCELPLAEADGLAVNFTSLASNLADGDVVFLGQPNNPTGLMIDPAALRQFAAEHATNLFVVDEAFADFVEGYRTLAAQLPLNMVVLCSLTKFYAIPGLRLGFAAAQDPLAAEIRGQMPNWSVNTLAQLAGEAALADDDYAARSRAFVTQRRAELTAALEAISGLYVYRGAANFLLVRINRADTDAAALSRTLLADGIAIRTFDAAVSDHRNAGILPARSEGVPPSSFAPGNGTRESTPAITRSCTGSLREQHFRIAVRTSDENRRLVDAIAAAMGSPRPVKIDRRTPALMFQGTSSNAGKSILTAALCRILLQDGARVAPFKAQNMSLNSFVTADGGEMGRAQVVQAQACRLEPDVRMNPVLLKPNSDTGSQVIVRGKPVGNMRVPEYVAYKAAAFAAAKECYDSLAGEYEAIVLEGAGSPGEVNLKSHDIVNMRMAQYARSPVLVVGDIDRGGVFASFVGTMEVLEAWERALVAGWVVNRFRGDASLLAPALDYTQAYTGKPVLGVVPYLARLNLPQEDSVEFKSGSLDAKAVTAAVEIAVIDLPHISNFTDFDAFSVEDDVRVRIVRRGDELGSPDAVVLPGSKNTLADIAYLKRCGLADKIARLAASGKAEIVGICGGFQMLGREIRDPQCIESPDGKDMGLGLLPVDTVMAAEKTLTRATARHSPSGLGVHGYEIHHGQTPAGGLTPLLVRSDGQAVGVAATSTRAWGTYLHGVFDADEFRRWFVDQLRTHKGLPALGAVQGRYDIEPALDRLAAVVRQSLDMDRIYRIMGLKAK